jgi:hypothetical protein
MPLCGERRVVRSAAPGWNVWVIDTGLHTITSGRNQPSDRTAWISGVTGLARGAN